MRPFQLSTDVVSIGELKVQAARILQRVNKDRCPIVITQHGKPAAVLVSTQDYDQMADHARFMLAVQRGLDDVQAGRVVDDKEVDAALEEAFKSGARK
jgi:prevent-host-death family protein